MTIKSNANIARKRLAHPTIFEDDLEKFLQRLDVHTSNLDGEIKMLEHLRKTSLSKDNLNRAAGIRIYQ